MTPRRLKQLAANSGHIPGVYNYCDRWCERCPLTRRCLNFAMEQEQLREDFGGDKANRDLDNQQFWKVMSDNLKLVAEMIEEDCRDRGIDFEEIQREARESSQAEDAVTRRRQRRREHPLVVEATAYMERASAWFKTHEEVVGAKAEELVSHLAIGLPGVDSEKMASELADAVAVVEWYHMFIGVKLARAVGREEEGGDAVCDDAVGSAKVALIAIDRSLVAWTRLREHFPDKADGILDTLLQLDRLRRRVEVAFAEARGFVRAGFDDGTLG